MGYPRTNTKTLVDTDVATASSTTLPSPGAERRWRIRKILAGYTTNTQAGTVTITNVAGGADNNTPTTVVFPFTGDTGAALDFGEAGLQCVAAGQPVVTLSAGAGGVTGHLTTIAFAE